MHPTMDLLPNDIVRCIGDELLNPCERSRLSTCSSHYYTILPTALRVKIIASRGNSSLQSEFFISPVEHPNTYIQASENLLFGHRYYFWTFDYARGNKVFLGRHTRHSGRDMDDEGKFQSLYTLGLRPCQPNQSWEITGGDYGDVVMWGEDVGLAVSGNNPKPRHPDSTQRSSLSCITIPQCQQPMWCVLEQDPCTSWPNEKMQLLRCDEYVPGEDIYEKELTVYAIPEVCDEGEYFLISPNSMKNGSVGCEGYHVIVDFHFWIEEGIMHFSAPSLPFALGIPILETDRLSQSGTDSPLAKLLEIKSARWGCVIYYMAVAADVGDGIELDMNRFIRRVTDHKDHSVVFDEKKSLVYVGVRNKKVDTKAKPTPSTPQERNALWQFILSW